MALRLRQKRWQDGEADTEQISISSHQMYHQYPTKWRGKVAGNKLGDRKIVIMAFGMNSVVQCFHQDSWGIILSYMEGDSKSCIISAVEGSWLTCHNSSPSLG